jgi:DNA-binding NarL/FixJ family response regulator
MPVLLLVEDNAILAATLVRFLRSQDNLSVAAVAHSAEAALEELRCSMVDLVLIDVALPGINGIDLADLLRQQYPALKCLMLSGHNEPDYVGRALAAGAKGYVVKSDPLAILEAVQRVLEGKIYFSMGVQGKSFH